MIKTFSVVAFTMKYFTNSDYKCFAFLYICIILVSLWVANGRFASEGYPFKNIFDSLKLVIGTVWRR